MEREGGERRWRERRCREKVEREGGERRWREKVSGFIDSSSFLSAHVRYIQNII